MCVDTFGINPLVIKPLLYEGVFLNFNLIFLFMKIIKRLVVFFTK